MSALITDAPLRVVTPGICQVVQSAIVAPQSLSNGATADVLKQEEVYCFLSTEL